MVYRDTDTRFSQHCPVVTPIDTRSSSTIVRVIRLLIKNAHSSANAASRSFFWPGRPKAARNVQPLSNINSLFS